MNNNDLNVFEILEQKNSETKSGQEQNVPDPFFQEALQQAIGARGKEKPKRKAKRILAKALEKGKGGWIKAGWIRETAIVAAVFLFLAVFVINISQVSGNSMAPNFYPGDRILILRPGKWNIERGDVIVFKTDKGEKLIKRVVAQEGDTVDISSVKGGLYINGREAQESNVYTTTSITDKKVTYPVTVEENSYFVLGDNRTDSKDSRNREIGQIKREDIIGKVIFNFRGI